MSTAPESSPESDAPPAVPLVSAGTADRCSVCAAHLAVDQRYCVECGTRRGAPRFSLAGQSASPAATVGSAPARSGGASRLLSSASAVLLIGLLILLIALGVGVLIGHDNSPKSARGANVTVNEIGGGAAASAATPATASGSSASSSTGSSSTGSSSAGSSTKSTAKASSKPAGAATKAKAAATGKSAPAAAAKSFGSTATKQSTLGGKCTPGTTGCSSGGKQTGNLF